MYFSQKRVFFRNFRDVSTNTPKITFYCIFINKFPKMSKRVLKNFQNSKKVLKIFSRRRRRRENPPFSIFCPPVNGTPPWRGRPPTISLNHKRVQIRNFVSDIQSTSKLITKPCLAVRFIQLGQVSNRKSHFECTKKFSFEGVIISCSTRKFWNVKYCICANLSFET